MIELKENCPSEVREYFKALDAAATTRDEAQGVIMKARPDNFYALPYAERRQSIDAWQAVQFKYEDETRDALSKLRESEDPQVRFIMDNCMEYPEEAQRALSRLPLTLAEATQLILDEEWCSTGDDFLDEAQEAGILPGADPLTPATRQLLKYLRQDHDFESYAIKNVKEYVEQIQAEARSN